MASFSNTSLDRLSLCHPDLQTLFRRVVLDFDCTIVSSYRTKDEQNEKVREGFSKVGYPSTHNTKPCIAVDVAPYLGASVSFDLKDSLFFAGWVMCKARCLYQMGIITHEITCGADWNRNHEIKDTKFMDPNHFEIIPNFGDVFKYYET
jgi:peptidoglycan L-alanyl-D-glutamate endopeptidase CwlK